MLAVSAIAVALFQMMRSIALLRIEGRMDSAIQAAVWDRLLSLSADFFRHYSPGDLAERALSITRIKQILSGAVMLSVLAGLFSWFNLALDVLLRCDAGGDHGGAGDRGLRWLRSSSGCGCCT